MIFLDCSNYITYHKTSSDFGSNTLNSGEMTVTFSEDVSSWTIEVTFNKNVNNFSFWLSIYDNGTQASCSGSTCKLDYNADQSAGDLSLFFMYSYDLTNEAPTITDVSITSESTAFCSS